MREVRGLPIATTVRSGAHPAERVRLSVVIACLDAAQTLGEQLEALAAQPCPVPWELLVCDNGSTDDTLRVAERFGDRLPVTVVDAGAVRGAAAARNAGAAVARGEWLAFCDADDVVAIDWLDRMCAALRRHDFVAGRFEGTLLNDERTLRSRSLDQTEGLQRSGANGLPHAGAGNMGLRLELFRRVGGFDVTVPCLEDTDLSWRVQQAGAELRFVPDLVVHVRLRSSLRDMHRQGVAYGSAYALLEQRYDTGGPTVDDDPFRPSTPTGEQGLRARLESWLESWLGQPPSLGRLVWQLGWHRGHRRAVRSRRHSETAPI